LDTGVDVCVDEPGYVETAVTMDIQGAHITIVGAGKTAQSLAALLLAKGAHPFVSESAAKENCTEAVEAFGAMGVDCEFGCHTEDRFRECDWVIPSPGVSPKTDPVSIAIENGVSVIGEMEMASRFVSSKILAVTGTNGKTTTTEWLGEVLNLSDKPCKVVGNNDTPLSQIAIMKDQPEYLVVEVSSYQLETMDSFHPVSAAVLNLTPDHLGRHDTMEEYASVKSRIFSNQTEGDTAVINLDDPYVASMPVPENVRYSTFSLYDASANWTIDHDWIVHDLQPFLAVDSIPLPGNHNLYNALAVLSLAESVGVESGALQSSIQSFKGVEHRIEFVGECGGVRYFNDSKSTNLDSLKVALESFSSPLILLAGGEGKGSDYRLLNDLVKEKVKTVILYGADAQPIHEAWSGCTQSSVVADIDEALQRADSVSQPGDVVLLSPACASFDQFQNFEVRGTHFKNLVQKRLQANSGGQQYA
jgi:UDP-N-acetylmuramoylalanine--D-glutamate ligase